ncbi:MAG: hypothetical protein DRQ78_11040 [Epsilonproteobacteria bacterium]|nr:MAG: hypothetical protein DRQ78_11040 [Campylobacterota bacterium]
MTYPEHPDTIVVKNRFYPRGLSEIDIWNYYQKVKPKLLREVRDRDVMFFVMVDVNKPVVRRKLQDKFIRLTSQNYDQLITGRTVSIHTAMNRYENIGVIDIDIDPRDGFSWAKKVTADVYDYVINKIPIISSAEIRFTGKTSFHIFCKFHKKMKIDTIRFLLQKFLNQSPLSKVYSVGGRRKLGIPNIDLSSNKFRGNFIVLHALSVLGLKCIEVPYTKLSSFSPLKAIIKI